MRKKVQYITFIMGIVIVGAMLIHLTCKRESIRRTPEGHQYLFVKGTYETNVTHLEGCDHSSHAAE